MKMRDVLLAAVLVLFLLVISQLSTYLKETNYFENRRRKRDVTVIYNYRSNLEPLNKRQKEKPKYDEYDWSWLRKGARKYNEDGSLLAGGPIQVKESKIPVVYGDPSKGESTRPVPEDELNKVDVRDLQDQSWDRAFEASDTIEPGSW